MTRDAVPGIPKAIIYSKVQASMDTMWHPCAEPALTTDEWRALLSFDPERARRRYCHQVKLIALNQPELRPSVTEFQRLTQRHPENFFAQAYPVAQQCIEPMTAPKDTQADQWLWRQITTRPYEPTNPYTGFAGPRALLRLAFSDFALLSWQAREWRISLPTRPVPQRLSIRSDAKGRARLRAAWHTDVWMLAVAIEEAQLPNSLPRVRSPQEPSALAPYPDEADWCALLAAGRSAALRRLQTIELEEAKTGIYQCFNLGESIAAGRASIFEHDSKRS